jgi:hypothetical protein
LIDALQTVWKGDVEDAGAADQVDPEVWIAFAVAVWVGCDLDSNPHIVVLDPLGFNDTGDVFAALDVVHLRVARPATKPGTPLVEHCADAVCFVAYHVACLKWFHINVSRSPSDFLEGIL